MRCQGTYRSSFFHKINLLESIIFALSLRLNYSINLAFCQSKQCHKPFFCILAQICIAIRHCLTALIVERTQEGQPRHVPRLCCFDSALKHTILSYIIHRSTI